MASTIQTILDFYDTVNNKLADSRTKDWYLVGSPWKILSILIFYHLFIFKLGPDIMKNRKPLNLNKIIQVYNIVQVVMSLYLFIVPTVVVYGRGHFNLVCQTVDYSDNPIALKIANWVWMYYMLKVLDLLDTIFFVLRKKNSQVTLLHVYHHTGMVIGGYMSTKYITGGQTASVGVINSFVHAIMYSYYFISNYNPEYKKHIWWKKYITQLQMVQFLLIILHVGAIFFQPDCQFPRWVAIVFIPQNVAMLVLFSKFYKQTYLTNSVVKRE